ncbi:MAG TPA: glycosyltransferase [Pyrinomonadaceae bacterium]|nr:glycosyltransferase [Pyrinomonadaceae bacterium]
MKRVCIGIHLHTEPEQLRATLASVGANTSQQVEILLLPDGPDDEMRATLAELNHLTQSGTAEALGASACFNRLTAAGDAEILVLLESGALVAPRWLDHIIAALGADTRNGLAGPSTNYSWNEQRVFPHTGNTPDEIARTASKAEARFGCVSQTLEPLYSLADFCYVVRREVIEEVGAADEHYGLGPCWEMDYNVRAARAGFRGVWARAAYVHRSPFTARRRLEEARRFEASKRLYQDKFCGARRRGEKADYREHCRGDACSNFAPAGLIEIKRPLTETVSATLAARGDATAHAMATANASRGESHVAASVVERWSAVQSIETPALQSRNTYAPLVSCIMPTHDRRRFIAQAIRCFLRQDYPNLELLIVDDGSESIAARVPEDPRVRYVRLDQKISVGAKRNAACENARGDFIVHWDDDDWYPSWRVSAQMRALVEQPAEVCGSSRLFFYEAATDGAWEYRYTASSGGWVAGSTLAYRRNFWRRNPFPDVQVGEDSLFVGGGANAEICDLADPKLCVAGVHPGNTSPKETGGVFWRSIDSNEVHALLGDDLHFYRAPHLPASAPEWPLVSCIMPTHSRRSFIPLALQNFLAQDYPNKELIVIDDGEDAVADVVADIPGVRYKRLAARASIGAKRNLACEMACGNVIAHWDDDDWYAPDRLRYQVRPLVAGEADITGLENAFVLQLPEGEFWGTDARLHRQMFVGDVHGGTLVYRREILTEGIGYPDVSLAEDAWLLHHAVARGRRLLRLTNPGLFIYVRHGRNAWREFAPGRFLDPSGWRRIDPPHTLSSTQLASLRAAATQHFT